MPIRPGDIVYAKNHEANDFSMSDLFVGMYIGRYKPLHRNPELSYSRYPYTSPWSHVFIPIHTVVESFDLDNMPEDDEDDMEYSFDTDLINSCLFHFQTQVINLEKVRRLQKEIHTKIISFPESMFITDYSFIKGSYFQIQSFYQREIPDHRQEHDKMLTFIESNLGYLSPGHPLQPDGKLTPASIDDMFAVVEDAAAAFDDMVDSISLHEGYDNYSYYRNDTSMSIDHMRQRFIDLIDPLIDLNTLGAIRSRTLNPPTTHL